MEVCHKVFGLGTVKNISDSNIIVSFKKGDKKFQFPQAFNGFLTTEDPELLKQVDEAKNKLTQKVITYGGQAYTANRSAENERVFHKRDCPACAFNDGCYLCTVRPS